MNRQLRGNLLLIITALIWGVSFVAQKAGMEYIGPFTFNGIRFLLGSLVLIPVILVMDTLQRRRRSGEIDAEPIKIAKNGKTLITGGLSCGAVLFIAATLQQIGMVYTTVGKAGFITALYIVLVPIFGRFIGRKIRPVLWLCVALASFGLYLLCVKEDLSVGRGDLLMIASALGFAGHILVIDYFSPKADGIKLSCLQFLTAGLLSAPFMLLLETVNWIKIFACLQPILYSSVMSCGVAYTLQIIAQKDTEPTVASLIMSLESVFAVIAGILLLNEQVSFRETLGCVIMFAAILLAQLPSKKESPAKIKSQRTNFVSSYLVILLTRSTQTGREE
ncbi:MAG TPA: DMT family transporter [Anaerovoracaceae bacterium]|nr:DMT family transporter [Anaerovoracaceae bacterium]